MSKEHGGPTYEESLAFFQRATDAYLEAARVLGFEPAREIVEYIVRENHPEFSNVVLMQDRKQ